MTQPNSLNDFLTNNPWSEVIQNEGEILIKKPWGEAGLNISFSDLLVAEMGEHLNNLLLPQRFSALVHLDKKQVEFIWGLASNKHQAIGKGFKFLWKGSEFECKYETASDRLLAIARHYNRINRSFSEHRNLSSLQLYQISEDLPIELQSQFKKSQPVSFFVSGLTDFSEENLVLFAKHLNFFMSYFSRTSPRIEIHDLFNEEDQNSTMLISDINNIPETINGSEIDQFLLDLNSAAHSGDFRLRFLYYYQVLEYAAYYWIEDSIKAEIHRMLRLPDLQARLDDFYPKLIDLIGPRRQSDEDKIRKMIDTIVETKSVWYEISSNKEIFSSDFIFDGGFVLKPLISKNTTEEDFLKTGLGQTYNSIKDIRNALVHARESRTSLVIFPNKSNDLKLRPWLPIIRRIAEQITIRDV